MTFFFGRARRGNRPSPGSVVRTLRSRSTGRSNARPGGSTASEFREQARRSLSRNVEERLGELAAAGASARQAVAVLRSQGVQVSNDRARIIHRLATNRKLTQRQETIAAGLIEKDLLDIEKLDVDVRVQWSADVKYRTLYEQSGSLPREQKQYETEGENIVHSARSIKRSVELAVVHGLDAEVNRQVEEETGLPSYVVSGVVTEVKLTVERVQLIDPTPVRRQSDRLERARSGLSRILSDLASPL